MPSGQLMTMPILVVNMGGEMVYILEQRLQAQKIPEEKGQKVLNDVVRTMYYPRFIEELFKPQEMYSMQSTRQIFDRLAHSSIMRLNESSMDKLFDLMAMGFKYQIMSCVSPPEMIDVTHNHLNVLWNLVGSNPSVSELLEECTRQMQAAYGGMSLADFNMMRQSLCTFFQDRKVKVSLFLHDQTQNSDGSIVVPSRGTLPPNALLPGTVRYFNANQEVGSEQLPVISASAWAPNTGLRTQLGNNVYEKDKPRPAMPAAPATQAAPAAAAPPPGVMSPADAAKTKAAIGELNMLAELIGSQPASGADNFKLESLFSANVFSKDASGKPSDVIEIDGTAPSQYAKSLDAVRAQMDVGPEGSAVGSPDLLDLMDGTG